MKTYIIALEDHFTCAAGAISSGVCTADEIEWIEAIKGKDVDLLDGSLVGSSAAFSLLTEPPFSNARLPSRNAIGNYISHACAWKKILDLGKPAVILEEDCLWTSHIDPEQLEKLALENDVTLLGAKVVRHTYYGTHAYIVTPKAAKTLLLYAFPFNSQTDIFISECAFLKRITINLIQIARQKRHRSTIQKPSSNIILSKCGRFMGTNTFAEEET